MLTRHKLCSLGLEPFDQGRTGYLNHDNLSTNPYQPDSPARKAWLRGWKLEKADHVEARTRRNP